MKNSRNKILAAAVCGVIAGSVGTSIIGKFQAEEQANSKLYNNKNENSSVASSDNGVSSQYNNEDSSQVESKDESVRDDHNKGEVAVDSTDASGQYVDGTYKGTASGFSTGLKVELQISKGQISDIQVVSHNETPGFCERAIEKVAAEIISSQSTNVDTVSGATYTSVGIINAVNDALSSAQN